MEVKKIDLIDCHNRIKPFIHNTPVLTSSYINEITGAEVYFKCENFQKMGAFKMRGAANAILISLPLDSISLQGLESSSSPLKPKFRLSSYR